MKNPAFCTCKNKGVDQLNFFTFLIPNSNPLTTFFGATTRFVSDRVGNHEDRFTRDAGHATSF